MPRSVKISRVELGEPIYSKDFKRVLRRNRNRYIHLTIDNGNCGSMGIFLTYAEVNQLISKLHTAKSRLGCK